MWASIYTSALNPVLCGRPGGRVLEAVTKVSGGAKMLRGPGDGKILGWR